MITEEHKELLKRLKQFYPYRIVWGAVHKETGQFLHGTCFNKRRPNMLRKQGFHVVIVRN